MEKTIEEFVGIYKNAFPKDYCEDVIKNFNLLQQQGFSKTRQELDDGNKLAKDDFAVWTGNFYSAEADVSGMHKLIGEKFNEIFWNECYPHYAENFAVLQDLDKHTINGNKVQRTNVGQGYHVWHCEHAKHTASRLLFYILYLNDVEDGGETEFLYQSKRYKPEQGTLIIAPASFTHTHRGNPPLSNDKYIITSWVEF